MKEQLPEKHIDPLLITFIEMFQEDKYGYKILCSSIIVNMFYSLYNRLIQVDVKPIEMLSVDDKNKFWNIAKNYYSDQETAVKASKAAYILCLVSSEN